MGGRELELLELGVEGIRRVSLGLTLYDTQAFVNACIG